MVIFIKSFNRPYYLDRCLSSLEIFVQGEYKVIILDDGTPERYLQKIIERYPYITILRSEYADEKEEAIIANSRSGAGVSGLKIPAKFWRDSIFQYSDDYFLLLEDDMWFAENFNLDDSLAVCKKYNMELLKLCFFGNPRLISSTKRTIVQRIQILSPLLFTKNLFIFKNIIIRNPFKFFSILIKLGLVDRLLKINYYTIYSVAGCIFSKKYYHYLWNGAPEKVNEDNQLIKALEYFNKEKPSYGCTIEDVIKTSFSSSATNMFEGINFDVFQYNFLLNEAWFKNELNTVENFSKDISVLEIFIIIKNDSKTNPNEWEKWKNVFKNQYIAVGHQLPKED